MKLRAVYSIVTASAASSLLLAGGAVAHHPTGGMTPATWWHGLLSGIGHPILGLDHFAFVVGVGLLAGIAGLGLLLPLLFAGAMAGGLALHLAGIDLPHAEMLVALSVVLIGGAVWRGSAGGSGWREGAAFASAGLLHGYVFAETIIGAEPTPIVAYAAGLIAMQMTIAAIAWQMSSKKADRLALLSPVMVRGAGWVIIAAGIVHVSRAAGLTG